MIRRLFSCKEKSMNNLLLIVCIQVNVMIDKRLWHTRDDVSLLSCLRLSWHNEIFSQQGVATETSPAGSLSFNAASLGNHTSLHVCTKQW